MLSIALAVVDVNGPLIIGRVLLGSFLLAQKRVTNVITLDAGRNSPPCVAMNILGRQEGTFPMAILGDPATCVNA
jgi:hypothetical protein